LAAQPAKMVETKMGKVLATEKGMVLYTFDKDAKGKSNCDRDCLKKWPAFHAGAKAKAEGEWSLVKAADGKEMWAYEVSRFTPLSRIRKPAKPTAMALEECGTWPNRSPATVRMGGRRIALNSRPTSEMAYLSLCGFADKPGLPVR
jgi:predicted lipoprotein with Yx(FWY)xxD motif